MLERALPGGEPVLEVGAAGGGMAPAIVPPLGSCCCIRVPVPAASDTRDRERAQCGTRESG